MTWNLLGQVGPGGHQVGLGHGDVVLVGQCEHELVPDQRRRGSWPRRRRSLVRVVPGGLARRHRDRRGSCSLPARRR